MQPIVDSARLPSRRDFLRLHRRVSEDQPRRGPSPRSGYRRTTAMRSPVTRRPSRGSSKAVPSPPSAAVIAYNRAGFGPRPGDIEVFNSLGSTDAARMQVWVNWQLDPANILDSTCDARIAAAGFTTINKSLAQLWADHVASGPPWSVRMQPFWETERLTFLRAAYSRRQLNEILADFWHNHFNVYAYDYWISPVFVHYDRDVIRGNMLGNYRTMLEAVATSPAMLYYLDNYTSSNAGPNENFSRELFELHAMGAENYLGVMRQSDVPLDVQGRPVAYVDDDVFEATRCFTGWTVDGDTGLFSYRDDWHDRFQKNVLGVYIPSDQADLKDGRDVLDALASHPGTARYIARKLCRRLISDSPPEDLVDQAANVFINHQAASDQLARVVRTILLSDHFLNTWGEKVKRPFEITVSAMRAGKMELNFALDGADSDSFFWRYDQAGQPLFSWHAPTGFPDLREDWESTTPRVSAWRLVNWLVDVDDDAGGYRMDILGATPTSVRTANELADFWITRVLGHAMPAGERQQIVDFMAQGYNPDLDLPLDSDDDTRDRLRSMVGLIFMSPAFLWR